MNLPNIFSSNVDPQRQLFFAIHIADTYIQAALWQVFEGALHVLTESEKHDWQDDESCVEAIDQSLQELGKESEDVKETLFSLSTEWVNAQGIIPEKKPLFQKITKELSLHPVGFVVTVEAVVQHLAQLGNPQLSIFFIELSQTHVNVSLVKNGQITQTQKVGRSGDSVSDTIEAFAHFKEKNFPTKMLLFSPSLSAEEVEASQQQLIGFNWTEKYPFLHPPVIEVYPSENLLEVIVQTGGVAVAEAKHLSLSQQTTVTGQPPKGSVREMPEEEKDPPAHPDEHAESHDAHFTQSDNLAVLTGTTASTFNIPVSPDVAAGTHTVHPDIGDMNLESSEFESEVIKTHDAQHAHTPTHSEHPHHQHLPHLGAHKHVPILPFAVGGVIAGLLLLAGITVVSARSMVQAVVDIQLRSKNIHKEVELTLDPKLSENDFQKMLLRAEVVKKQIEGEKTTETTGKKLIGEKAKGKVTLFNRTSSSKTFAAGTAVKTGKLSFTLDQSVTVASASTGQNFETKPGTADVDITASDIGTDSNIAKDTDLSVESFSKDTYVARTSTALTGGSSREIEAVSQKDRDTLLAALKKELSEKAAEELKNQGEAGKYVVPTNRLKVLTASYSAEVGKETHSLGLKMSVEVEALAYRSSDLKPFATQLMMSEVPAGYELSTEDPEILSSPIAAATSSALVKLQTSISGKAFPHIEEDKLKQEILGKSGQEAENALRGKSELQSVKIQFTPPILRYFSSTVPQSTEKIIIRTAR